jgi:hypothetical protein
MRHPWVAALRSTEQGMREARSKLGNIVPAAIEEYNAVVAMEYFKVKL